MSPPQTRFEDVLDAGRRAPEDETAQRRVALVRANDAEAALEWQLLADFDEQREELANDDALPAAKLDAITQGVLARLREPEPEVAREAAPAGRAVPTGGAVSAGDLTGDGEPEPEVATRSSVEPEPEVAQDAVVHRISLAQSTTRRFAVAVGAVPSRLRWSVAAAAVVGLSLAGGWYARGVNDSAPAALVATASSQPVASTHDVGATDESADDEQDSERPAAPGVLLSRAERAKGLGRAERAASLYHRILREAPYSREAEMARLGLGRVLLEDLNAPERALDQFDAYLARYPDGLLRPEAQVGRAEALGQAGRVSEERRAWRNILDDDPEGAAADLARHATEAEVP